MRRIDDVPRLTQKELADALRRRCAIRLFFCARSASKLSNERDFYVVRLSGGMVKVDVTSNIKSRLASLTTETTRRFPGIDQAQALVESAVVVSGAGHPLEAAMLGTLRCERVGGEWFRGRLADSVVEALLWETREARAHRASGVSEKPTGTEGGGE